MVPRDGVKAAEAGSGGYVRHESLRTIVLAMSAGVAIALPAMAHAQSRQWGSLVVGPHAVGFRLAGDYDRSRRVGPATDYEGRPNAGPLAMSMQVGIWYPATRPRNARPMQYGEFAALGPKRNELSPVTPA